MVDVATRGTWTVKATDGLSKNLTGKRKRSLSSERHEGERSIDVGVTKRKRAKDEPLLVGVRPGAVARARTARNLLNGAQSDDVESTPTTEDAIQTPTPLSDSQAHDVQPVPISNDGDVPTASLPSVSNATENPASEPEATTADPSTPASEHAIKTLAPRRDAHPHDAHFTPNPNDGGELVHTVFNSGVDVQIQDLTRPNAPAPDAHAHDAHLIPVLNNDNVSTASLPSVSDASANPVPEPEATTADPLTPEVELSSFQQEYATRYTALLDAYDDTEEWNDPDTEDVGDFQMVAEYADEILAYCKEREQGTLPKEDYIDNHPELTWTDRRKTLEWIYRLHADATELQLRAESYFHFVNIFDRFLSLRADNTPLRRKTLRLVAIACFYLAIKFGEKASVPLERLRLMIGYEWAAYQIKQMEGSVLEVLGFDLGFLGPTNWLWRGGKERTIARYLLDFASLEPSLVAVRPSLQVDACLWLARLMLPREGQQDWGSTAYKEDLLPTANAILSSVVQHTLRGNILHRKYHSWRYNECPVQDFVLNWTTILFEKGSESEEVNLVAVLPVLRAIEQRRLTCK
ncbi:G2/mitotic-specific cyclin [Marasmius crinis-equi]|uniref:G2/mitotic-specific cyclin n=1 Tax=Marasmius crinis-equi TaxID=585013 RepID=A0ABR3ESQ4_9AGAR